MPKRRRSNERISVLLVPASKGSTLTFQTTKKRLLLWLLMSFASIAFMIVFAIMGVVKYIVAKNERSPEEFVSTEFLGPNYETLYYSTLDENQRLQEATVTLENRFAEAVRHFEDQIDMFTDMVAFPVDGDLASAEETSDPGEGRGGPLAGLDDSVLDIAPALGRAEQHIFDLMDLSEAVGTMSIQIDGQLDLLRHTPLLCPIQVNWRSTDRFGWRRHPITGDRDFHNGMDMAAPYGSDVLAPADGEVTFAGRRSGYGRLVIIDHGTGARLNASDSLETHDFTTHFGHLSSISVEVGDHVSRGDRLGRVGSTGYSTGAHLHYEVRIDGEPTNPIEFIVNP